MAGVKGSRRHFKGSNSLRIAYFQAAFTASQHDPELKTYDKRKRALMRSLGD
jgi:hypothetical protein